jgi:T5SS/PEP-CTERM-associated repeat protein
MNLPQNSFSRIIAAFSLLACVACAYCPTARAADIYWQFTENGAFSDPAKWTPSSVPGSADTAIFRRGNGAAYTVVFPSPHPGVGDPVNYTTGQLRIGGNIVDFIPTFGSTYTVAGVITVGESANQLAVLNLALPLSGVSASIGEVNGATGWLNINSGSGSLSLSDSIAVGILGIGELNIQAGGSASSSRGFVALWPTTAGTVNIAGPGSNWAISDSLYVGANGNGSLTIEDGGWLSSNECYIAVSPGSSGAVSVTAAGSSWTMAGRLSMGGDANSGANGGTGTLTIGSGGMVDVAQDTVLFPDGLVMLAGGSFGTTEFDFRGGQFQWNSGTLHVDFWDGNLTSPSGGTLAPGRPAGSTTILGHYFQSSGAALEIEIGGTVISAEQDFVNVFGAAILSGALQLKLINDFTPAPTDTFTVLNATGGIAGVFGNVTTGQRLTTTDGRGSFLVHYGTGSAFTPSQIVLTDFEAIVLTGDCDDDGDVDQDDHWDFENCLAGPMGGAGAGCACFDFDGDGDVTLADWAAFQINFIGR